MAQPVTIKFGKMRVYLGDGESPEVFTAPCGFTERSFTRSKSLNETQLPDCLDEDAAVVVARDVASIDWAVTGQGVMASEAVEVWDAFYDSTDSRNVRVEFVWPAPLGTITYTGLAHLENFEIGATVGNRVTVNISLAADGALTRSPVLA